MNRQEKKIYTQAYVDSLKDGLSELSLQNQDMLNELDILQVRLDNAEVENFRLQKESSRHKELIKRYDDEIELLNDVLGETKANYDELIEILLKYASDTDKLKSKLIEYDLIFDDIEFNPASET